MRWQQYLLRLRVIDSLDAASPARRMACAVGFAAFRLPLHVQVRRHRRGGESASRTYLLPMSVHAILVAALLRLSCGGSPADRMKMRSAVARRGTANLTELSLQSLVWAIVRWLRQQRQLHITGCPSATGITRILRTFRARCSSASPSEPLRELNHPLGDMGCCVVRASQAHS